MNLGWPPMKPRYQLSRRRRLCSLARSQATKAGFLMLLITVCLPAWGQTYSINWFTIDGGGGASGGGSYSLSGTIGQHDAGLPMTGGNYAVVGGFWSIYALQTAGAPLLSIKLTSTNTVQVYWNSPSTGWNLQVNTDLITTNWVAPLESVQDDGIIKFIIVNPPAGNRFYRLKFP